SKPDVASTGTTGRSGYGVVDITVGPYYVNNPATCSWAQDWGFSAFDLFQGGSVRPPPPIGGGGQPFSDHYPLALAHSEFTVAVNLGDNEIARCLSWTVCQTSGSQPTVHLYSMNAMLRLETLSESRVFFPPNQEYARPCTGGTYYRCLQVLCGMPARVESLD